MISKYSFWVFKNALPEKLRSKIKKIAREAGYGRGLTKEEDNHTHQEEDLKVRNSDVSFSSDQFLYNELCPFVHHANREAGWKYDVNYFEGIQVARYQKSQHYAWHNDGGSDHFSEYGENAPDKKYIGKVRKLSLVAFLSNGFKGGDLEFALQRQDQENEILYPEMQVGDVIVFPSFVWHRSTPITQGTKYSASMWCLGPPFK